MMNIPQAIDYFARKKWAKFMQELEYGEFQMPFYDYRHIKAMRAIAYNKYNMNPDADCDFSFVTDTKLKTVTIIKTKRENKQC